MGWPFEILRESLADEAKMRHATMEWIESESAKIRANLEQIFLDRLANRISKEMYESLCK